jgi:folate-dependent phosphoribosylglycinamide formyltransferase PurN
MKVLCIVGSQLRHQYFLSKIIENFEVSGIILFERTLVQPPKIKEDIFSKDDLEFEQKHLAFLKSKEEEYFNSGILKYENDFNIRKVESGKELNCIETIDWVKSLDSDVLVDYGSLLLSNEFLDACPEWKINLHGGLSPWYKGSATLFWPLYFQQPELAGITYHILSKKIDGGELLQHYRPVIKANDSISDIGCRAIKDGSEFGIKLLKKLTKKNNLDKYPQKTTGKLFLEKDYKPAHLRVAYQLIQEGMLERYLNNKEVYDSNYKFVNQVD